MITAITLSAILMILFARLEAANDADDIKASIPIHHRQAWISRAAIASIFSLIAHSYNVDFVKMIALTFYQGGIFGIVFTITLNILQGRHPLEIGTTTGSWFDKAFNKMFGNQSAGIMEIVFFVVVAGLSFIYYILK